MEEFKKYFYDRLDEGTTTINFTVTLKNLHNKQKLPDETQKFLYREIDSYRAIGQNVIGYVKNKIIIDMNGYWKDEDYFITSYGIKNIPQILKEYPNLEIQWKI